MPAGRHTLQALYEAMSGESCVNLRFFALMEEVRKILGIRDVGQTVYMAYQHIIARDPKLDDVPLEYMFPITMEWLQAQGGGQMLKAWDQRERRAREIEAADVRVHLRHIGYSD